MWRIRQFIQSIKSLIRWFPTIWRDRNWDSDFIYEILKKKLEFQADHFERVRTGKVQGLAHVNMVRDEKYMRLCVNLIDKLQHEYWNEKYMKIHNKKWGEVEIKVIPSSNDKSAKLEFLRSYVITDEDKVKEREDFSVMMKIVQEKTDKARRLLFKVLNDRIEHWWE